MIVKTRAILLHHVRHSDNSLIASFYTKEYGRLSVMVKGVSSKKVSAKYTYFQPLYLFDLEVYHNPSRDIQTLKELNLAYTPKNITSDLFRSTVALFLSEVLYGVIREEDINIRLFSFLESSVIALDSLGSGSSNFHLWFLCALSAYVGIGPTPSNERGLWFDMASGQFEKHQPLHPDYMDPHTADLFNTLLSSEIDDLDKITLTGETRNLLLEEIIKYYNLHLPGMRKIRSLGVLNEVFR